MNGKPARHRKSEWRLHKEHHGCRHSKQRVGTPAACKSASGHPIRPHPVDTDLRGIDRRNLNVARNHGRPWIDGTDAAIAEISSGWTEIVKIANSIRPESGSERSTRTREVRCHATHASRHDA